MTSLWYRKQEANVTIAGSFLVELGPLVLTLGGLWLQGPML